MALLDSANKEISKYIKKTGGVYTKARYKEIAKKLKEVSKSLKKNVEDGIDLDGIIDYELKKEKKLLNEVKNDIVRPKGGEINFIFPSLEQIKTAALFKPVDVKTGMTYESYLDGIENGLYNIWDAQVRTGYLTGVTTNQIVRNVLGGVSQETKLQNPGIMQGLRNSIYGNTRTVLQSFANETRNRVMEENEKYFGDGESDYRYEYLACLDNRTCIVCGNLDGKLYKKIEDAPSLPQHRGCRCMLIPYFDIDGDTRASKYGYVDADTTFEEWLKGQDDETQKDVLGATRYKLYKEKNEAITVFVDNGKKLTLDELSEKLGYDVREEKSNYEKSLELFTKKFPSENYEEVYDKVYRADGRIPKNSSQQKIYEKEFGMLKIASDNGHTSFMLPEGSKGKNVDSIIDGKFTELKKITGGESALSHRFRDALSQGDNVYLEITKDISAKRTKDIIHGVLKDKLNTSKKKYKGLVYCYFDNTGKFYTWNMNDLYY